MVEQTLQMGNRQDVFEDDWSVKDECRDLHVIPVVTDGLLLPELPACLYTCTPISIFRPRPFDTLLVHHSSSLLLAVAQ